MLGRVSLIYSLNKFLFHHFLPKGEEVHSSNKYLEMFTSGEKLKLIAPQTSNAH